MAAALAELETLRALVTPPAPEVEAEAEPIVIVAEDSSEDVAEAVEDEESLPEPELVEEPKTKTRHAGFFGQY